MKKTIAFLVAALMVMLLIVPMIPVSVAAQEIEMEQDTSGSGMGTLAASRLGPVFFVQVGISAQNAIDAGITNADLESFRIANLHNTTEAGLAARENYTFTLTISEREGNGVWVLNDVLPMDTWGYAVSPARSFLRFATTTFDEGNNFIPEMHAFYDVTLRVEDAANNRVITVLPAASGHRIDLGAVIAPGVDGYMYSMGGFTGPDGAAGVRPVVQENGDLRVTLHLPNAETEAGTPFARARTITDGLARSSHMTWNIRFQADGFDEIAIVELNTPPYDIGFRDVFTVFLLQFNVMHINLSAFDLGFELPENTDFVVTMTATSQADPRSTFRLGMYTVDDLGPPDNATPPPPPPPSEVLCERCGEPLLECQALCGDEEPANDGEENEADWLIWAIVGGVVVLLLVGGVVFVIVAKKKKA